jgi:hypothetical protein
LLLSVNSVLAEQKPAVAVGVVMSSHGGQVSQITAQNGSSLFVGDTLNTDSTGSLIVRFGASLVMLDSSTVVKVNRAKNGIALILQHGKLGFSTVGSPIELQALGVIVHPREDASRQLLIVGPCEFQIGSTRGSLNVDIDGVDKTVTESTAYDVTLDNSQTNSAGAGRDKRLATWIVIAGIALATAYVSWVAFLSRSKFTN